MKSKTILVVEDNVLLMSLIEKNLKFEGYKVLAARDGQQGFEMLFEHKPDLVWLDMNLPVMDGHEFLRRIDLDKKMRQTPVVVVTVSMTKHEVETKKFNIVGCFIKSETPISNIVSAITRYLSPKTGKI